MFLRVNSTCAPHAPPLAAYDGCRNPEAPTVLAQTKEKKKKGGRDGGERERGGINRKRVAPYGR